MGSHRVTQGDSRGDTPPPPTFAAAGRHLGEGVVAAVAVAPDDTGLAGTLPAGAVAEARQGPGGVTVAEQTGVAARGAVVVLLGEGGGV